MLLDCFVTERKHQLVKAAIRSTDNTVMFERGGLARCLTEHIRGLNKFQLYMNGIVGDSCEYDGGSMGLYLKWRGDSFGVGDMVFIGQPPRAAEIKGTVVRGDCAWLLIHWCDLVEQVTLHASRWTVQQGMSLEALGTAADVRHACAWSVQPDGSVMIIT